MRSFVAFAMVAGLAALVHKFEPSKIAYTLGLGLVAIYVGVLQSRESKATTTKRKATARARTATVEDDSKVEHPDGKRPTDESCVQRDETETDVIQDPNSLTSDSQLRGSRRTRQSNASEARRRVVEFKQEDDQRQHQSKLVEEIAAEYKCAICMELYVHPFMLECKHMFCGKCVLGLLESPTMDQLAKCPSCRKLLLEAPQPAPPCVRNTMALLEKNGLVQTDQEGAERLAQESEVELTAKIQTHFRRAGSDTDSEDSMDNDTVFSSFVAQDIASVLDGPPPQYVAYSAHDFSPVELDQRSRPRQVNSPELPAGDLDLVGDDDVSPPSARSQELFGTAALFQPQATARAFEYLTALDESGERERGHQSGPPDEFVEGIWAQQALFGDIAVRENRRRDDLAQGQTFNSQQHPLRRSLFEAPRAGHIHSSRENTRLSHRAFGHEEPEAASALSGRLHDLPNHAHRRSHRSSAPSPALSVHPPLRNPHFVHGPFSHVHEDGFLSHPIDDLPRDSDIRPSVPPMHTLYSSDHRESAAQHTEADQETISAHAILGDSVPHRLGTASQSSGHHQHGRRCPVLARSPTLPRSSFTDIDIEPPSYSQQAGGGDSNSDSADGASTH